MKFHPKTFKSHEIQVNITVILKIKMLSTWMHKNFQQPSCKQSKEELIIPKITLNQVRDIFKTTKTWTETIKITSDIVKFYQKDDSTSPNQAWQLRKLGFTTHKPTSKC